MSSPAARPSTSHYRLDVSCRTVIEEFYGAVAGADVSRILGLLSPDVIWIIAAGFPYAGTYVGADVVVGDVFKRFGEDWSEYRAVPDAVVSEGHTAVAIGTYYGVHARTGKSFRARFAHVYTVEGGKIARMEQIVDSAIVQQALPR